MERRADIPLLTAEQAADRLKELQRPWAAEYLAMYSTWLGGMVTDPWLMSVPLDDHLVHRGDGVFEAIKCVGGRVYQLKAHLERMFRSAASIHLEPPLSLAQLTELALAVVRAGGRRDCMLRIFLSRGPGGFTTNPFECPQPGLYIMVSLLHTPPEAAYENGVRIGISRVPAKSGFFANVKSCNYLPNVLLKREAGVRGWDYAVGLDEDGAVAEGSTENIGLVNPPGWLLLPLAGNILEGTTAQRVLQLARALVENGELAGCDRRPLSISDLRQAQEVMLFGTTLDVLPVAYLEGEPIGQGRPGPIAKKLRRLIKKDIAENPDSSTPAFD